MSALGALLVDLVGMAETPLYSAYKWLGRQIGHDPSLAVFFRVVNMLIVDDVLRLWHIDHRSHDRTELYSVPAGLDEKYQAFAELDDRFDPFGYTLTVGPGAPAVPTPEWEIDLDIDRFVFQLTIHERESAALDEASACFPDLVLVPEDRRVRGNSVLIVGRIERR